MGEISVDPAVLRATGHRLIAAVEVAREVGAEGGALGALVADTGHDRLAGAVETFLARWAHGIGCLVEDAETLAGMLTRAGTAYGEVESAVARACGPPG